jgi:hypothetical protein
MLEPPLRSRSLLMIVAVRERGPQREIEGKKTAMLELGRLYRGGGAADTTPDREVRSRENHFVVPRSRQPTPIALSYLERYLLLAAFLPCGTPRLPSSSIPPPLRCTFPEGFRCSPFFLLAC